MSFKKSKCRYVSSFYSGKEASTTNHNNVFTLILPFSEGRAGKAWEPCNNILLFLTPEQKRLTLLPHNFLCYSQLFFSFPSSRVLGHERLGPSEMLFQCLYMNVSREIFNLVY
jgi:hypothetical protein